ncbi:MAG: hypothetical protein IPH73_13580 [Rhodocyclales bacterium]|nr:hypothetical protein [Rhodocyclales bacterium]
MNLKRFVQGLPVYDLLNKFRYWREWRRWKSGENQMSPHYLKRRVIADYAERYDLSCLVESGTYFGEMVAANRRRFSRIVSIELDVFLFQRAARRFRGRGNIEIVQGDSGEVLPRILETIDCRTLFWLDAHYSGGITARGAKEAPIEEEICSILRHPVRGHVILVDDARMFDGRHGYPTLDEVNRLVGEAGSGWDIDVRDDILRIVPRMCDTDRDAGASRRKQADR